VEKASDIPVNREKIPLIARLRGVGRWTFVVIVLGLALIGLLHLARGTAVRHVRGVTADGVANRNSTLPAGRGTTRS
jgi:hypothetical protein